MPIYTPIPLPAAYLATPLVFLFDAFTPKTAGARLTFYQSWWSSHSDFYK